MKYINTLFVVIALFAVSTVNAQTASKLNGQSYTYVMKDMSGTGDEIIDSFTFGVGQVTSTTLSKAGYTQGKVLEKNAGKSSDFEVSFKNASGETYVFTGKAEGISIDGTVLVTDANGVQSTLAFRGMLTEEWNNVRKQKEEYQKQQNAK